MNLAWLQEQKRMTPGMDGRYLRTLEDIETWWNLEQLKFRAQMRAQKIEGGKDRRGKNRGKKKFYFSSDVSSNFSSEMRSNFSSHPSSNFSSYPSSNFSSNLELQSRAPTWAHIRVQVGARGMRACWRKTVQNSAFKL